MADALARKVVYTKGGWTTDPDLQFNWFIDPVFEFATEAEALQALEFMAEDLRAAQEQALHIMRYIKAAITQAVQMPEAERPRPQALINHTRLARQTVYDAISAGLRADVKEADAC